MRCLSLVICGLLLLCCGCGPTFSDQREVSLGVGDIVPIAMGPFKKEQTIRIEASSPGAPISIYVHAADQTEHVDYAISYGKEPSDTFAGVASTEGETLTAVVPADTEIVVRLQTVGQQAATVSLNMTN